MLFITNQYTRYRYKLDSEEKDTNFKQNENGTEKEHKGSWSSAVFHCTFYKNKDVSSFATLQVGVLSVMVHEGQMLKVNKKGAYTVTV